jgi:hypothetical protein
MEIGDKSFQFQAVQHSDHAVGIDPPKSLSYTGDVITAVQYDDYCNTFSPISVLNINFL